MTLIEALKNTIAAVAYAPLVRTDGDVFTPVELIYWDGRVRSCAIVNGTAYVFRAPCPRLSLKGGRLTVAAPAYFRVWQAEATQSTHEGVDADTKPLDSALDGEPVYCGVCHSHYPDEGLLLCNHAWYCYTNFAWVGPGRAGSWLPCTDSRCRCYWQDCGH